MGGIEEDMEGIFGYECELDGILGIFTYMLVSLASGHCR